MAEERTLPDAGVPGESLWAMIVAPTIWAVHFLACYILAAIWCAKAGRAADPAAGPVGCYVITWEGEAPLFP